jgi:purine nucleoside permease
VWAEHVVDGDLAYEIDARELPADWPSGYVPLRKTKPFEQPLRDQLEGELYTLNQSLVDWAFALTRSVHLEDTDGLRTSRQRFAEFPNAGKPPFVTKGDTLSASTFWHGKLLDEWANAWVRYYTGGKGNYMISAMEDSGTMQALTFLDKAGRADINRVLVLRTVSNFDRQPANGSAAESLKSMTFGAYSAYRPALEAAQRIGDVVVRYLVEHWDACQTACPGLGRSQAP